MSTRNTVHVGLSRAPNVAFEAALAAWRGAVAFDPTVDPGAAARAKLRQTWVEPRKYSRASLFDGMKRVEPRLFTDFPIDSRTRGPGSLESVVLPAIRSGIPPGTRARVRSSGSVRYQAIPEVLDRWTLARTSFAVTDLHYIGTRFDRLIDTHALNEFNLLPRGSQGFQSQDSLVISTAGSVTDSHADDHSGSNHCFVGRKLWLLWDTLEGLRNGLEDASHCVVTDRAAFDATAFLQLHTARWLVIEPGQTMFIPAHLSHKVITLERYVGLGSFHATLPGLPDLIHRWHVLQPYWSIGRRLDPRCTVDHLVMCALRRLHKLRRASNDECARWGLPELIARLNEDMTARGKALGYPAEMPSQIPALRQAAFALINKGLKTTVEGPIQLRP